MKIRTRSFATTVATVCTGALLFSACSKDAATVSQSKLESTLKSDKEVSKVTDSIPNLSSTNRDKLITCIASTLRKDANGNDLQDYVDGKSSLNNIGGANSNSESKAKTDVATCIKSAIGG